MLVTYEEVYADPVDHLENLVFTRRMRSHLDAIELQHPVCNTGPRVPAGRIRELFQPFRRLHTRTRTDGAGLGLSIAASIARAHHATLVARPNPGGGLELTVAFGST